MLTEMVCEISAMQEFPAGMAADCCRVVGGFHRKGLCNFQGGHRCNAGHVATEEHIFLFHCRALRTPAFTDCPHHAALTNGEPAIAVEVGINIPIGGAMDLGVSFEEVAGTV